MPLEQHRRVQAIAINLNAVNNRLLRIQAELRNCARDLTFLDSELEQFENEQIRKSA